MHLRGNRAEARPPLDDPMTIHLCIYTTLHHACECLTDQSFAYLERRLEARGAGQRCRPRPVAPESADSCGWPEPRLAPREVPLPFKSSRRLASYSHCCCAGAPFAPCSGSHPTFRYPFRSILVLLSLAGEALAYSKEDFSSRSLALKSVPENRITPPSARDRTGVEKATIAAKYARSPPMGRNGRSIYQYFVERRVLFRYGGTSYDQNDLSASRLE